MPLLLFTDLDGTLLGYADYSAAPAAPALEACRRGGVPVIVATSKTRAEVVPLLAELGLEEPFIVENGAALYLPAGHFLTGGLDDPAWDGPAAETVPGMSGQTGGTAGLRLVLGRRRSELITLLDRLAGATGLSLRGVSAMDVAEMAERTGLPEEDAARALDREFSEPFVLEGAGGRTEEGRLEALEALRGASKPIGDLNLTMGGRFFHLQGGHSKADGLRLALRLARLSRPGPWSTMALGDSHNDREMLQAADEGVLVQRHDGSWARLEPFKGLRRMAGIGPVGWNQAVLERLQEA